MIDKAPQAKMPPDGTYEWTESNIDIILKDHTSDETVKAKNIETFFKLMEVPEIGKGIATKLVQSGFDIPQKGVENDKSRFPNSRWLQREKADKIYSNIQNIIYNDTDKTPEEIKVQLIRLMAASNLLGRGIAVKTIKSILDMYPDIITSKETTAEKMAKCVTVKGVAEKNMQTICRKYPQSVRIYRNCKSHTLSYITSTNNFIRNTRIET